MAGMPSQLVLKFMNTGIFEEKVGQGLLLPELSASKSMSQKSLVIAVTLVCSPNIFHRSMILPPLYRLELTRIFISPQYLA